MKRPMELRIASIGFGNVARALVTMLRQKEGVLREQHDLSFRFTGALTRRAGGWMHPGAIDASALEQCDWPKRGAAIPAGAIPFQGNGLAFLSQCDADVVLELTALSPHDGQPAIDHIRAALSMGRHVVTANKGPIAHAYKELRGLARARGLGLRFESTVMDGTPLFGMAEACMPATEIKGFRGVLNSTSNFILGRMAQGESLEDALVEAQTLKIAEANPTYDLEGWDASVKAAVLANVLMDANLKPADVEREGLGSQAMRERISQRLPDQTVKQVVDAWREDGKVRAAVRLELLPSEALFSRLRGMEAALLLQTDTLQDITLVEGEGGPEQTAFGVLADLIQVARMHRAPGTPPQMRR